MIELKLYIDIHNSKERLFAKFTYDADVMLKLMFVFAPDTKITSHQGKMEK